MNPAYKHVRFRLDCRPESLPAAFAVITACNPDGRPAGPESNRSANDRLLAALEERGTKWFPVIGGSADFSHAEPGFGVAGMTLDDAVSLGREFRQEAIFWVEAGVVYLVSCGEAGRERVGRWAELLDSVR